MQEYARFYEKSINFAPTLLRKPRSCTGEQCRSPVLPGFNLMGWCLIFNNEKRPKVLKFGRFVYIFVYKFSKSLKINVYCGERGSQTLDKVQFHEMPFCRKQGFSPFPSVFYNTTQCHLRALKSCTKSCTWVFVPFFVYIIKIHQTLTLHGL